MVYQTLLILLYSIQKSDKTIENGIIGNTVDPQIKFGSHNIIKNCNEIQFNNFSIFSLLIEISTKNQFQEQQNIVMVTKNYKKLYKYL